MANREGVDLEEVTCRGCDTLFAPAPKRGRQQEWCSERCRVWFYRHGTKRPTGRTCTQCGAGIDDRHALAKRCGTCAQPPTFKQRPCSVCGTLFQPRNKRQHLCPPEAGMRRSKCAKRWERHVANGTPFNAYPPFDCVECGKHCIPGNNCGPQSERFCSVECKGRWHRPKVWPKCRVAKQARRSWVEGRCQECGDHFTQKQGRSQFHFCSEKCQRKEGKRRRRAAMRGAGYKTLGYWTIAERDNWTCQLCGKPVDMKLKVPDFYAPTMDHIIPLGWHGSHTEDNVQLAHFICNSRKSDGLSVSVGEQTTLV